MAFFRPLLVYHFASVFVRTVATPVVLLGAVLGAPAFAAASGPKPPERISDDVLRVVLELGSDFSTASEPLQEDVLKLLRQQGAASDAERLFAAQSFAIGPDSDYAKSVEAEGVESFDYLRAVRTSYARYRGAQSAPDRKWVETHLKSARRFAGLAADALLAEAALDEQDSARLCSQPWAARRAPDKQMAFVERLRREGLPARHHELLLQSGRNQAEVAVYTKQLLEASPDAIGASTLELLSSFATARRELAEELRAYAQAGAAALAVPSAQTFLVHNPHDRTEQVELMIRRVSLPATWKLAVVDPPEPIKAAGAATLPATAVAADNINAPVQEIRAGEHYRVTLPAKGQVRVASVVIPIGSIGENTTARWAVEGFIRDELIGGMMHEMSVPAVLPEESLQPIVVSAASTDAAAAIPPPRPALRLALLVTAAFIALATGLGIFLIYRRRHRDQAAHH